MGDPRFRRVLWLGIGLTIALLVAVYAGFLTLITTSTGETTQLPLIGEVRWLNDLLGWSSFFLMLILSMFLMVPVASAITSMFLNDVAQAVEDKHYPQLSPIAPVPFSEALRDTLSFLGLLIVANVVALFIYAMLPWASLFIFWGLNGYLLGREYFQLAAMRRIGRESARELRRQHRMTIWVAGILMAMPLTIPLLNLVIPILGAATFTHLFHAIQSRKTPSY